MNAELIKLDILNFFNGIIIDEDEHKYYLNGKPFKTSVSGIIKNFHLPFDKEGISKAKAQRDGVSQESLLKEWATAGEVACAKGHKVHSFGEVYPFNKELKPRNSNEEAIVKFWNDLPEHIIPVMTECMMYHKKYLFAGTMDILLYNTITDTFIIADYKTNKDLFKNWKGKRMIGKFSHLLENPFNKYQIQLSLYQILLEQIGNIKVSSRKIIWLQNDGEYKMYDTDDYTDVLNTELEKLF